jgi:hypothetical protein
MEFKVDQACVSLRKIYKIADHVSLKVVEKVLGQHAVPLRFPSAHNAS